MSDDEYDVPLRDQRYFGAGLKRKRVKFVASTTSTETGTSSLPSPPIASGKSVANSYLATVLKKRPEQIERTSESQAHEEDTSAVVVLPSEELEQGVCDICHRPVSSDAAATAHNSSIAHQICLQHSHPPSHIDRKRKGLAVLEGQGWDPDNRKGLGATGQGRLHPIKAKENPEKAGLGLKEDAKVRRAAKPVKLDAGKVRMLEKEGRKRAERLRNSFYRSEDVEKYLGDGGQMNASLDLATFRHESTVENVAR